MLQHKTGPSVEAGFYCNVEFELYKVIAQLVFLVQLIAHLLYSITKAPHQEGSVSEGKLHSLAVVCNGVRV